MLTESLAHEGACLPKPAPSARPTSSQTALCSHHRCSAAARALVLYKELLEIATDQSVYLEEFARNQIAAEELHNMDIKKMQRDYEGDETVIVRSALSLRRRRRCAGPRCGADELHRCSCCATDITFAHLRSDRRWRRGLSSEALIELVGEKGGRPRRRQPAPGRAAVLSL